MLRHLFLCGPVTLGPRQYWLLLHAWNWLIRIGHNVRITPPNPRGSDNTEKYCPRPCGPRAIFSRIVTSSWIGGCNTDTLYWNINAGTWFFWVFFNLKNINLPNRGIGYLSYLGNAQKKTFGMFCLITSLGKGGPSLEYWPELSNTRQRDCNAGEARDNVLDQECYTWHNENAGNI